MSTELVFPQRLMVSMQRLCRSYVDILERGGPDLDIQKFLVSLVLSTTADNKEFKTTLMKNWPNYFEDMKKIDAIVKYKYPQSICDELLSLNLDKNVRILDVACGPGHVARILQQHDFINIDGLDASPTVLELAQKENYYRQTYCCYIKPDEGTPIDDGTYDVLLCSAGMYSGNIIPSAKTFKEFARLVKAGGILAWNIDEDYKSVNDVYDEDIQQLIDERVWVEVQPRKKLLLYFSNYGYVHVMRKL